ncbi:MAG: right-handed parallel beta-helix repeat-containing protein [Planctomycetes bacterium]|nr:right-handed parallel beta-helix repeat-containing protein [Planctomycetota bacterium]
MIEHAYDKAIYAESGQAPWVHDNTIRNSPYGVYGTSATVEGNTFDASSNHAVHLNDGSIRNNLITDGSGWGIYLTGTGTPTVTGNTVTGNAYPIYQGASDPIYSGNDFSGNTNNVIGVGGTLNNGTVWEDVQGLGMPYLITSDVTVPADVTLRIDPGVVVKFEANTAFSLGSGQNAYRNDLIVNGTLDIQGIASNKVVFTSSLDDVYGGDSNGDGASTSPRAGHWGAIKYANPNNVLHDAVLRYGGLGRIYRNRYSPYNYSYYDLQMVWMSGEALGTLEIRNSVIEHAYDKAIYAESGQAPWVHDNTIRNANYGVYGTSAVVEGNTITASGTGIRVGAGSIRSNIITGADSWGIYLTGTGTPTVTGNTVTGNAYPIYQGASDPIYSGNDFSGNTNSVIGVGGTLANGAVWEDVQGLPYLVVNDVTVPSTRTLTINGGVVVKFNSGRRLTIQGTYIDANAAGDLVVFTSYRDDTHGGDTNGDGNSSGIPGDWSGIYFQSNDNLFDHALVRYAGANISGSDISMRYVTFDYAPDPAVRIQSGGPGTTIHNVNFLHTLNYGVRNDTGNTIDARNNYWGDPTGPSGVGAGNGAGLTSNVLYDPWLSSPAVDDGDGPVITSSPRTAALALRPYDYDADRRASANGTGAIVWSKMLGPDDFQIHADTGEITWAPIEPGDYVVGIAASDDVGATDQVWQIHVDATGDTTPPQIASFAYTITDEGGGRVTAELIATFNEGVQVRPIDVALLDSGDDPMTITSLSYEVATHELTIVAEHLTANAIYTLRLLDTITDDALNPLDGEFDGSTFPTGNGSPSGDFVAAFRATTDVQDPADLTGNGFVDFEDLTVLLAAWNQNVSAAEGNLVDADGTPVNFEDLTVLLAAWTGPGPAAAGAGQAAVVRSDRLGPVDQDRMNPVTTSTSASTRRAVGDDDVVMLKHNLRAARRAALRFRPAGGSYGRLQAAAVDRAMGEEGVEATLVRHSLRGRRRDRS